MRKIILLSMLLMLSACSSWSTSKVDTVEGYQASNISTSGLNSLQDIVVTETDMSDRNYTVAGDISVTVNKTTIFHKAGKPLKQSKKLKFTDWFRTTARAKTLMVYIAHK